MIRINTIFLQLDFVRATNFDINSNVDFDIQLKRVTR